MGLQCLAEYDMETENLPAWALVFIPLSFFIIFPLFWCAVLLFNSHLSGWRRLATRYRSTEVPKGQFFSGVECQLGIVTFRSALECTVSEGGLFLQPAYLFRYAHPLLFIPWTELRDIRRGAILWLPVVRADIGVPRLARIRLSARVFDQSDAQKFLSRSGGGNLLL